MKFFSLILVLIFSLQVGTTQDIQLPKTSSHKGDFYLYWGYNRGWFTDSDIQFTGTNYNFTLENVVAKDRQSPFEFNTYFHPEKFTIPQYNFRVGYFIKDHYSISIGTDHMKYVLQQHQTVKINGEILETNSDYNGVYENDDLNITSDFLQFEHTDGLNYGNIDIRRFDTFLTLKKVKFSLTEGVGFGLLIPRTNTTLLGNDRYDKFHLSGYGINALASLQVSFWDLLFVQSEFKAGFISMPNIRTTENKTDKASQQFLFSQLNFLVGFQFDLKK